MNNKTKKVTHVILKVLLSLILIMPILGVTGIFPEPTRELYNTDIAFDFINLLYQIKYIDYIVAIVFAVSIALLWTKRDALAALLMTPITVNIVGFHLFLDGGLFTGGAMAGNILLLLNICLLYKNKEKYKILFKK